MVAVGDEGHEAAYELLSAGEAVEPLLQLGVGETGAVAETLRDALAKVGDGGRREEGRIASTQRLYALRRPMGLAPTSARQPPKITVGAPRFARLRSPLNGYAPRSGRGLRVRLFV